MLPQGVFTPLMSNTIVTEIDDSDDEIVHTGSYRPPEQYVRVYGLTAHTSITMQCCISASTVSSTRETNLIKSASSPHKKVLQDKHSNGFQINPIRAPRSKAISQSTVAHCNVSIETAHLTIKPSRTKASDEQMRFIPSRPGKSESQDIFWHPHLEKSPPPNFTPGQSKVRSFNVLRLTCMNAVRLNTCFEESINYFS
jgi:hypothetical protein